MPPKSAKQKTGKGPKFARCNECTLVFGSGGECRQHAYRAGHKHNPAYHCTVCFAAFRTRRKRQTHVEEAGHVQVAPKPGTYAKSDLDLGAQQRRAAAAGASVASTTTASGGSRGSLQVAESETDSGEESESSDEERSAVFVLPGDLGPQAGSTPTLAAHTITAVPAAPAWQTSATPATTGKIKISPNPVRCNQCRLVCKDVGTLAAHAKATGHAHKPMYFCTVCLVQFNKLGQKRVHALSAGHYPGGPASTPAPAVPSRLATAANTVTASAAASASTPQPSVLSLGASGIAQAKVNSDPQAAPSGSVPSEETKCMKCAIEFPSADALQAHYTDSALHPTCRTCGLGFASIGTWAAHKARCPPPGSTAPGTAGGPSEGKGKEVARDVKPGTTAVDVVSLGAPLQSEPQRRTDPVTVNDDMSASLPTNPSEVSSITLTAVPSSERAPSPTPSISVSSTSGVPDAHSTTHETPQQAFIDRSRPGRHMDSETRSSASVAASAAIAIPSGATMDNNSMSTGERTRGGTPPIQPHQQPGRPTAAHSLRPPMPMPMSANPTKSANAARVVSFHCRSCLRDPCVEPVATVCGHIFCHRCIVQELSTNLCCPVCRKMFFIRLHVEVD